MRSKLNAGIIAAGITLGVAVLGGSLLHMLPGIQDVHDVVSAKLDEQAKTSMAAAALSATIEEFRIENSNDTGSGYDDGSGERHDGNGNIIPPRRDIEPTEPSIDPPRSDDTTISTAVKTAWQEYCTEGGGYNQGLYGSATGGRHDCSGFVNYVLNVKCGIPGPNGNSGDWWTKNPAGFTLLGTFHTVAEVAAVGRPGDILSYDGHVEFYMGNNTKAGWGGYGGKLPNSTFPTNPAKVIPCPTPLTSISHGGTVKLFRYGG